MPELTRSAAFEEFSEKLAGIVYRRDIVDEPDPRRPR